MAGRRSRDTSCCLAVRFCSVPPGSECLEFALWGLGGGCGGPGGGEGGGERGREKGGNGAGGGVPPPEKRVQTWKSSVRCVKPEAVSACTVELPMTDSIERQSP